MVQNSQIQFLISCLDPEAIEVLCLEISLIIFGVKFHLKILPYAVDVNFRTIKENLTF